MFCIQAGDLLHPGVHCEQLDCCDSVYGKQQQPVETLQTIQSAAVADQL